MISRGGLKTPEQLFGDEISHLRKIRGLSQKELGFQAGVHRTYVSQVERGLKSPTLTVLLKLTHTLGCSAGPLVSHVEKRLKKYGADGCSTGTYLFRHSPVGTGKD